MGLSGLKSRCQQCCSPSHDLQGRVCFLVFTSCSGHLHSLACSATPIPKLATLHLSNSSSVITATSDHSWERLSDFKDAVIRQAPLANPDCSPKPNGHNLIPPAKFLLPYRVTYSQVLGTRMWAFSGHFPYPATIVVSYCGIQSPSPWHLSTSIFAGLSGYYLSINRKFWTISRLIHLSQMIL